MLIYPEKKTNVCFCFVLNVNYISLNFYDFNGLTIKLSSINDRNMNNNDKNINIFLNLNFWLK